MSNGAIKYIGARLAGVRRPDSGLLNPGQWLQSCGMRPLIRSSSIIIVNGKGKGEIVM